MSKKYTEDIKWDTFDYKNERYDTCFKVIWLQFQVINVIVSSSLKFEVVVYNISQWISARVLTWTDRCIYHRLENEVKMTSKRRVISLIFVIKSNK